MRDTRLYLLEIASDVSATLQVGSYCHHALEDGDYIEFRVHSLANVKNLLEVCGNLEMRITAEFDDVVITIWEGYKD